MRRCRILYIEDEEDYQILVKRILGQAGFDVITADTGQQGWQRLEEKTPALLLLDINLPDTDGYSLCRKLRENITWQELPVIMLTVRRRPDEWLRGFASGANDYVPKPIDPSELLARVLRGLEDQETASTGTAAAEYSLVKAAAAGNRRAFEILIQKYRERLTESMRLAMSQPALIEDVVSQTFMAAYKNLAQFRGAASFYTWLYRIALNEAQSIQKKSRAPLFGLNPEQSEPGDHAAEQASKSRALLALSRVKQPYRRMLNMFVVEELPYDRIARRMKIPVGTVMSRLFKARQLLQDAWRKTAPGS